MSVSSDIPGNYGWDAFGVIYILLISLLKIAYKNDIKTQSKQDQREILILGLHYISKDKFRLKPPM